MRQGDGSYTPFETTNTPPYGILRTIPNLQKDFTACPVATGLYSFTVNAVAQLPSGYNFAISGATPGLDIAVFDTVLNLVSEATCNYTGITSMLFADLNGDGLPDLIGAEREGTRLAVSLGTGGASFTAPVVYPIPGSVRQLSRWQSRMLMETISQISSSRTSVTT